MISVFYLKSKYMNKTSIYLKYVFPIVMTWLLLPASFASTEPLKGAIKGNNEITLLATDSQKKIDKLFDMKQVNLQNYLQESKRLEQLKIYNQQLMKQLDGQSSAITGLTQSIEDITVIERQITPLLLSMIRSLEAFISLDVPFNEQERKERITFLKEMMKRGDISVAEQFRQVFESYQIEVEYGATIEASKGSVDIRGLPTNVEFLRVGRIVYLYRTFDNKKFGAWNERKKRWEKLSKEYAGDIQRAFKVANKQTAPEMLILPVAYAEKVE